MIGIGIVSVMTALGYNEWFLLHWSTSYHQKYFDILLCQTALPNCISYHIRFRNWFFWNDIFPWKYLPARFFISSQGVGFFTTHFPKRYLKSFHFSSFMAFNFSSWKFFLPLPPTSLCPNTPSLINDKHSLRLGLFI